MTSTHTYHGIVWLDLESPTDDEVSNLVRRYGLHPLVGEEMRKSPSFSKVEFYPECTIAVLTLPVRRKTKNGRSSDITDREINFIIGKNFLITTRRDTVEQLEYFAKIFDANSILNKDEKIEHAGFLFYYMVKRIYSGMFEDLQNIKDSLVGAESRVFKGDVLKIADALSAIGRRLIDYKQATRMHRDIWDDILANPDKTVFGKDFIFYTNDIRAEYSQIQEIIMNILELQAEVRKTSASILNLKQYEMLRILAFLSSLTFPLLLVAAIFSIPSHNVPTLGMSFDWITILGIMAMLAGLMLWYLRKKSVSWA